MEPQPTQTAQPATSPETSQPSQPTTPSDSPQTSTPNNSTLSVPPAESTSTVTSAQPRKKSLMVLVIAGLILLLAGGVAAYYMMNQQNQADTNPVGNGTPVPEPAEDETVVCTMDAMECPDGSFVGRTGPNCEFVCPGGESTSDGQASQSLTYDFLECNTIFTYPDKQAPYYPEDPNREASVTNMIGSGAYWQTPRAAISADLLSLIDSARYQEAHDQAAATFTTREGASGYLDAAVNVACMNSPNISTTEAIIPYINKGVESYNSGGATGMGPEKYTVTTKMITKWGMPVVEVQLNEDTHYTFIREGRLYDIAGLGETTDPEIIKQRTQILDSLTFM